MLVLDSIVTQCFPATSDKERMLLMDSDNVFCPVGDLMHNHLMHLCRSIANMITVENLITSLTSKVSKKVKHN